MEKLTTVEIQNKIVNAESVEALRELLSQLPKNSFYDRLNELMIQKNMTPSQLINATGITKSLIYEITSEKGKRKPQKYQIIKIGIAMGLTVEELNELLKLANHKELYAKNNVDAVIIFGIEKKKTEEEIEELLIDAGANFSLFE